MGWTDVLVLVVIAIIIGGAVIYIYKAKKSGKKCIGCPDSGCCSKEKYACGGSCGCCSEKLD